MRKLKIYKQSSTNYRSVPTIILKGTWLQNFGFDYGKRIIVYCEKNKITIKLDTAELSDSS